MVRKEALKVDKIAVEIESVDEANELYASGEWGKPRYSDKRDKYIMVRRDAKIL